LESFNFSWVDWIKNIRGFSPHKWSWSPPQMIVDMLYGLSEITSHTFSVCVRLYHERSFNLRFFMNVCEKPNQLILIHFNLFTNKYPPPSPSSLHFRPFQLVNPWLRVRECFGCVLEKENELSWFISSRKVTTLT
jgi:hypothetical protein